MCMKVCLHVFTPYVPGARGVQKRASDHLNYVYMCVYVWVCTCECRYLQMPETSDPPTTGLQAVGRCSNGYLGNKLQEQYKLLTTESFLRLQIIS